MKTDVLWRSSIAQAGRWNHEIHLIVRRSEVDRQRPNPKWKEEIRNDGRPTTRQNPARRGSDTRALCHLNSAVEVNVARAISSPALLLLQNKGIHRRQDRQCHTLSMETVENLSGAGTLACSAGTLADVPENGELPHVSSCLACQTCLQLRPPIFAILVSTVEPMQWAEAHFFIGFRFL